LTDRGVGIAPNVSSTVQPDAFAFSSVIGVTIYYDLRAAKDGLGAAKPATVFD
jgi:hypothetical protein